MRYEPAHGHTDSNDVFGFAVGCIVLELLAVKPTNKLSLKQTLLLYYIRLAGNPASLGWGGWEGVWGVCKMWSILDRCLLVKQGSKNAHVLTKMR